ncbi:MAG: rod shape-determining protein RodA [Prolixibacteraceae bacterium]|nr:rod shape-determining protein RodA [Prolixibacteraceae bacterium]
MRQQQNIWYNVDWLTVFIILLMMLLGWLNIYSSVFNEEHSSIFDLSQRYGKQLLWIGLSFIIGVIIINIDSKFFVAFSYLIYGFFIALLVIVLFFGKEINGARSWFVIGSFAFQPSEFAKFATALALAKLISSYNFNFSNWNSQLKLLAVVSIPVLLIILQNDVGSALVFMVFLIPLFREGLSGLILFFVLFFVLVFVFSLVIEPLVLLLLLLAFAFVIYLAIKKSWRSIGFGLLVLIGTSLLVWLYTLVFKKVFPGFYYILFRASILSGMAMILLSFYKRKPQLRLISSIFIISVLFSFSVDFAFENILGSHQQDRINNLLGLEYDPLGAGYNVNQSKIAIGSGGFGGKGFLKGTQTKYDFVPEQSTDFIFCTVGEEWGFVGTTVILCLFFFLVVRLILLAEKQRSVFSRFYGYSVASVLFFHVAVNIGMTIGLAPVIGIPLPFFSYGGSSLWFFSILIFVFLRLDANRLDQLH